VSNDRPSRPNRDGNPRRGNQRPKGEAGRNKDQRRRSDSSRRDESGRRSAGGSSRSSGARHDKSRPQRPHSAGQQRSDRSRFEETPRTEVQKTYDGPEIPAEITGKELDRSVTAALKSLPEKLALRVARHLVAAGLLLESDPKTAYEHTLAARARASRLAVVREAVGEAAYAAGEYGEALSELRAARRMNGAVDYIPIMADCERALGRPDRALTLVKNAPVEKFSPALLAELRIVESGARRDRKEFDAALRTLEGANLMSKSRDPWVARLRYAYADTLQADGQLEEALAWFHRAEAVDLLEATDAAERAARIETDLQAKS
jgi:tetratricopeptide (TPR) repeat protein